MDYKKLNYFKNKLLEEKTKVLVTIKQMDDNEPNTSLKEYFDELSVYDNHPADIGTETFMMEQNINLKNNEKQILIEIDSSLNKIQNGTYGRCEKCGKGIDDDRLELIPYVRTCIGCKKDGEIPIESRPVYRPIEEDSLGFPFGRTFNDITVEDKVGVDGEDIYQSVARFNEIKSDPSQSGGDDIGVYDDIEHGIVQEVDKITNGYYKGQIEGLNRTDIPDEQMKKKNE